MGSVAPDRVTTNPLWWLYQDLRLERQSSEPLPPGELDFSVARTRRFARDPLPAMLEAYRRYGPIFTLRVLHAPVVFMLGPEANHFVTVSHAGHFHWREGSLGDLIPFLGDGLLTTDGAAHRQARRIMLPAFHRERIAASADTMLAETDRAMASWRPGATVDLYAWTRELALRIALRALFGLEPERRHDDVDLAAEFERGLSYYGADYFVQALRGPGTPWRRMRRARARLDRVLFAEIARRRADGERREDVLSLLLDARDEHGATLTDGQVRDQVMTLLFAGHDTTTSTVTFLFYELARQPRAVAGLLAEQEAVLTPGAEPTAGQLVSELPRLEMAMDETLRLYPPAWVGPRRAPASTTARGPPTTCPRSSRTRRRSSPSASPPLPRPPCPRAPTCRSAAGRARASGCASASSRSRPSPRASCAASDWSCCRDTSCASARCRPCLPATACLWCCASGRSRPRWPARCRRAQSRRRARAVARSLALAIASARSCLFIEERPGTSSSRARSSRSCLVAPSTSTPP